MKTPITAGTCYDYANDYWLKINDDFPDITAAFYPEEFKNGIQERIYKPFFSFCHHMLKEGKKLSLQTMTWGYNNFRVDIEGREYFFCCKRCMGIFLNDFVKVKNASFCR